jgi:hypothetical protein
VKANSSRAAAGPFFLVANSTLSKIVVDKSKLSSANTARSAPVAGLAQRISSSTVSDCIVRNSHLSSGANTAAGLAARVSASALTRCASVSNTISSKARTRTTLAAGFIGSAEESSTIALSRAAYNTTAAPQRAAGFIAVLQKAELSESYVRGGHTTTTETGAGTPDATSSTGEYVQKAAGFCLSASSARISNCYVANSAVTARGAQAFGFGESADLRAGSGGSPSADAGAGVDGLPLVTITNCYSEALLTAAVDQSYPFMSNGRATAVLSGVTACFGAWRNGYNSITGGATVLAPWQITSDAGLILALGSGAGQSRWDFSAGNYPLLIRNP